MNEDDLMAVMQEVKEKEREKISLTGTFSYPKPYTGQTQGERFTANEVVIAQYPITSTELHTIANGKCCKFNDPESNFSIRFLLEKSFASKNSQRVINRYIMQVVVSEKKGAMRKEDIAVKTKIVKTKGKVQQKYEAKQSAKMSTKVEQSEEDLF